MASYTDQAIVLNYYDLGEADKVITLLTKNHGKLSASAKGVRKPESRKGGNLDLFNLVSLKFNKGRSLDVITEAEVINSFENLKKNLRTVGEAYFVCELINVLVPEEEKMREVFNLVLGVLNKLDFSPKNLTDTRRDTLIRNFEIRLLKTLGFWSDKVVQKRKPQTAKEWRRFNQIFIEYILNRELNSPRFLEKL